MLCFLSALFLAGVVAGKDPELRIGVKKRPETCDLRSKAGDRLSMHYTVSVGELLSPCMPLRVCVCVFVFATGNSGGRYRV